MSEEFKYYNKFFKDLDEQRKAEADKAVEEVWDFIKNSPKKFNVTIYGKDERTVLAETTCTAKNISEARNKVLIEMGITIDDLISGKVSKNDITLISYQGNPFKIGIIDRRDRKEGE